MKDKVQKIREEVERLKSLIGNNSFLSDYEKGCNDGREDMCDELISIIDSLQEEPVSSIWHDASEKSNKAEDVVVINPSDNTGEILTGCIKVYQGRIWAYTSVLLNLDNPCKIGKNLQEEHVSNDLEEAAHLYVDTTIEWFDSEDNPCCYPAFIAGAQWQKQHLWKSADGDELPEYEREVVVLHQPYPLEGSEYAVSFAHRPDPKGWNGTNIVTGKVEHYTPKTYDKGGWNSPDIKWWLDLELPCGGRTISMNYTDKNKEKAK